jgi:hypothetical protein
LRFERDMNDELVNLPPHAQEELIRWCELLIADGYDLGTPSQLWEAAGYLVANGYTEDICPEEDEFLNVGETACILAFASDNWDGIKNLLSETDNGAEPEWTIPTLTNISDLQKVQLFTLLSGGFFILLLAYAVNRAKRQKS